MKKSLGNMAYEKLKNEIISSPIEGIITEQVIGDRYGISRSPARHALERLCIEGYVQKYPKKGYVVKNIYGQPVMEKRQIRYFLELGAASEIINNFSDEKIRGLYDYCNKNSDPDGIFSLNTQFHLAMMRFTGNNQAEKLLISLIETTAPTFFDHRVNEEATEAYLQTHKAIIDAMLERNIKKAASAIIVDINMSIST